MTTDAATEPATEAGRRFVDRHGTGKQLEILDIERQARAAGRREALEEIEAAGGGYRKHEVDALIAAQRGEPR